MTTLMRKFMAQCLLIGMLVLMFVTTLPAMGAGEEEESLPILHGVVKCKKADESQHFTFKEHNGQHYTGQYRYCGQEVPFSADLTNEDGTLILTGEVTLPEPIEPELFTMTKEGDRGWILKIFNHEFEMDFFPCQGLNYTVQLSQGVPLDMVWIDKGYWIGKYEVTQAQYQAVMGSNPSCFKGTDLPVENMTWYSAMDCCKRLTEQERAAGRLPAGYEYTLPTAAQWEYAATVGMGNYNIGNRGELSEAWLATNSQGRTHSVGLKRPNSWGLYDMYGNVSEWYLNSVITGGIRSDCGGSSWKTGGNHEFKIKKAPSDYHTLHYNSRGFRIVLSRVQ